MEFEDKGKSGSQTDTFSCAPTPTECPMMLKPAPHLVRDYYQIQIEALALNFHMIIRSSHMNILFIIESEE